METLLAQDVHTGTPIQHDHVICPICPTVFTCSEGWIHHMRMDHWWDLDESDRLTVSLL